MVKSINERAVRSLTTFCRNAGVFRYRGSAKSRGTFFDAQTGASLSRGAHTYIDHIREDIFMILYNLKQKQILNLQFLT